MTMRLKWWIVYWVACLLIGFGGGILFHKVVNAHEVHWNVAHGVTVLRGTNEVHVIGPPRSSMPAPKVTTQPVRRGGLARIGRIGGRGGKRGVR